MSLKIKVLASLGLSLLFVLVSSSGFVAYSGSKGGAAGLLEEAESLVGSFLGDQLFQTTSTPAQLSADRQHIRNITSQISRVLIRGAGLNPDKNYYYSDGLGQIRVQATPLACSRLCTRLFLEIITITSESNVGSVSKLLDF